jgi:hypothetical protein
VPATTVLRALVLTEIVLLSASVLTLFLPSDTTPLIDDYLSGAGAGPLVRIFAAGLTPVVYLLGALAAVFLTIYVVALIGLLCLKSWSRRLYVFSFVVGACIHPFMGSLLVDPISGTINYIAAACSGSILATLFLSDAKAIFEVRTPNRSLERTRER